MKFYNTPVWFATAPCIGKDRMFFSALPSARKRAVRICQAECANRSECLAYALENNLTIGVWGGITGPDLERLVNSND